MAEDAASVVIDALGDVLTFGGATTVPTTPEVSHVDREESWWTMNSLWLGGRIM